MTRPIFALGLLALGLASTGARAAAAEPGARSEVPIREVVLSDGARRYSVPIQVGATVIEAGLDSGSSGLRILPGVLGEADAKVVGGGDTYSYGSGAELDGVVGHAEVGVGTLAAPISVQLIRKVGCTAKVPKCPASRIPQSQYGVQGDGLPGEGFKAIIGVNMAEAEVVSPLRAIGAERWIIELPRPGETTPGRLILNPTEAELTGYALLPVVAAYREQKGGLHDAVGGCILNDTTGRKACGALLMDTGAPGIAVVNGGLGGEPWAQGPATLAFYDGRGRAEAAEKITTGLKAHASRLEFKSEPANPNTAIMSGLTAYFAFSVLYDPEHGLVGLRPRPPAPEGPQGMLVANQP